MMNLMVDKLSGYIHGYTSCLCDTEEYKIVSVDIDNLPSGELEYVNGEVRPIPIARPSFAHFWDGTTWKHHGMKPTVGESRKVEYPPIAEQLDMLFHSMDRGEIPKATTWYNTIKQIKDKHSKE